MYITTTWMAWWFKRPPRRFFCSECIGFQIPCLCDLQIVVPDLGVYVFVSRM